MQNPECDNLDDYLAGWLSDNDAAGFEAHLAGCPACRRELDRQRGIDQLLARGAEQLEPIPSSLIDRIEGQIRSLRRRRAIRWGLGLSAAAAVLLAVGFWCVTQNGSMPLEPDLIVKDPVEIEDDGGKQTCADQHACKTHDDRVDLGLLHLAPGKSGDPVRQPAANDENDNGDQNACHD